MGFAPGELALGLERLFRARGWQWWASAVSDLGGAYEVRGEDFAARIETAPLPEDRVVPTTIRPRSLLTVEVESADAAERLRRDILFAFMRSGG